MRGSVVEVHRKAGSLRDRLPDCARGQDGFFHRLIVWNDRADVQGSHARMRTGVDGQVDKGGGNARQIPQGSWQIVRRAGSGVDASVVHRVDMHVQDATARVRKRSGQLGDGERVPALRDIRNGEERHRGVTVEDVSDYGYTVRVPEGYDEAVIRSRLALKGEGFSIITEMHVGGMLGPAAGNERQYLIMGAWSLPVAKKEVGDELEVAVHMPCNVVVQESGASAIVAALDPADGVETEDAEAVHLTNEARAALTRVLERIAGSGA